MLARVNTSNNVRQWAPHSLTLIPSLKRPAEQAHISHVVRQVPWLVVVISIFTLDWRWIRIQHWISFQNGVFGCGSLVWLLSFHDCIVMFCLFLLCRKVIQNAETFPRWLWKDRKTLLWLLMSRKARLKTNVRNNNSSLIKEFYRHGKRWKSENLRKFLSGKKKKETKLPKRAVKLNVTALKCRILIPCKLNFFLISFNVTTLANYKLYLGCVSLQRVSHNFWRTGSEVGDELGNLIT